MNVLTRLLLIPGILVTLPLVVCLPRVARAETVPDPIAVVVAKVKPAVVKVLCVKPAKTPEKTGMANAEATDAEPPVASHGSGFLIDPRGFVATNKHVVEGAISVFVETNDGVRYKAKVVGETSKADIALLKIEAGKPLPTAAFGDSDKVRPGDMIIVIGSPLEFTQSVSAGVVSAVNRDIMESPFDDYIQTDAAINHGNSGGPMFNMSGEVIGMNSVLFAPGTNSGSVGLGFAIPSKELNFVYTRLMATGRVSAGMLPIRTQEVTWLLAQATGAPGLKGALIDTVDPAGDKMMKGLIKAGDIILSFNGHMVSDPRDLARLAAQAAVGSDAALEVFRDGQRSVVHVPILEWPEGKVPTINDSAPNKLGLTLSVAPSGGALVNSIDPMGSAASSGIQKGDIIVGVQAKPVSDPDQARDAFKSLTAENHKFAAVLVERSGQRTWVPFAVPR